jgi:protein phosphatase
MSKSTSLHPTAQRLIVDEDAVFLLTSDGLSDFDRVEDYWETEILPILTENGNIESVAQRLIEIANTKNGHDNVTVALIHYQVKYSEPDLTLTADLTKPTYKKTVNLTQNKAETYLNNSTPKTQVVTAPQLEQKVQLPLNFLAPLTIALIAGSLGYWMMQWRSPLVAKPEVNPQHHLSSSPATPTTHTSPTESKHP